MYDHAQKNGFPRKMEAPAEISILETNREVFDEKVRVNTAEARQKMSEDVRKRLYEKIRQAFGIDMAAESPIDIYPVFTPEPCDPSAVRMDFVVAPRQAEDICMEVKSEKDHSQADEKKGQTIERYQNHLTLEQLHQMNGQPVWCVSFVSGRPAEWSIIRIVEMCGDWFIASSGAAQVFGGKNTYGKDWLAYAYKPIDFDKWEPCLYCVGQICATCENHLIAHYFEPCCSCVKGCHDGTDDLYKPLNFCPECGRPLTPDARRRLEKRITEN